LHGDHAPVEDHGDASHSEVSHAKDPYYPLTWNEVTALVVVVIAAILIGLFPRPLFEQMDQTAENYANHVQRYIPGQAAQGEQ
jgi:NADH:ubiquinone oxidoreductase subunit 4 (subunit M)